MMPVSAFGPFDDIGSVALKELVAWMPDARRGAQHTT
jgi:hypothetical protein